MRQHLRHALNRVQSLPNATAYLLARAFAFFFELINLAENDGRWRTMV
jgi:phosphoenolpyruvate carboxylase